MRGGIATLGQMCPDRIEASFTEEISVVFFTRREETSIVGANDG